MITFLRRIFISMVVLLNIISCQNFDRKIIEIDFSENQFQNSDSQKIDTSQSLKVALAAIISPKETYIFYEDLFNYLSENLKIKIEFKQRPTYREVNSLLVSNDVDIALICSGAYIDVSKQVDLLVVPLCNGQPYYQAYVITQKESDIKSFADFQGKSFVYTDKLSNTGKLYADKRVNDLKKQPEKFFSKTSYSYSHDISIQMVAKNLVDGASVDGLIFDYLKKYQPWKVENIKVIEMSPYHGIPPIVTSKKISPVLREKIKDVLLNMHKDGNGKKILENLLIDKFIVVDDTLYNSIRKINKQICH